MSWAFVAAGVGSLAGGYLSAKGAKEAGEATSEGQEAAARLIREQADEAKRIIFKTIPIAERNLQAGTQAGLNVLGQSIQPRSDLARGGNIAAQNTLMTGLGQQQGAILGTGGFDPSQFQAYEGGAIPDINYQLPEYESAVAPFQDDVARMDAAQGQTVEQGNQVSDTVAGLYQELFGRAPDPAGFAIYSRTITEGGDLVLDRGVQKAREAMMNSDEYRENQAQQTLQQPFQQPIQVIPQQPVQPPNLNPGMLGRNT